MPICRAPAPWWTMGKNAEALAKTTKIHELQPTPVSESVLHNRSSLELIRSSCESKKTALLHWHNGRSTTGPEHVIGPHRYIPTQAASVIRHLPSQAIPYGSTQELFCELSAFIAKCSGLSEEQAELLPFICLVSFFAPWLSFRPVCCCLGHLSRPFRSFVSWAASVIIQSFSQISTCSVYQRSCGPPD